MKMPPEVIANQKVSEVLHEIPDTIFFNIYNDCIKILQTVTHSDIEEIVQTSEDYALVWADAHKPENLARCAETRDYKLTMTALCLMRLARHWRKFKAIFQHANVIDYVMQANGLTDKDIHHNYKIMKKESDMRALRRLTVKDEVNQAPVKETPALQLDHTKTKNKNLSTTDKSTPLQKEMVNHPDHYKGVKLETIDIIEDFDLNFNLGNILKYLLRCESKGDALEDLEKARWYLEREIDKRKSKLK